MKRLKQLFVLVLSVLLLSGCKMKAQFDMVIRDDKSMDFNVIMAMDDELIQVAASEGDENSTTLTDEQKWKFIDETFNSSDSTDLEKEGFTKEKYVSGEYKGYKYSKKVANIDEISDTTGNYTKGEMDSDKLFAKTGNTYKASLDLGADEMLSSEDMSYEGMDLSSIYDMKFTITLPNKPISHNATEVSEDGKTLTWDVMKLNGKTIDFEFELAETNAANNNNNNTATSSNSTNDNNNDNNNNTMIFIIGGIALVVIIVVIVLVVVLGKKKKNNVPVAPVYPGMQPMNPGIPQAPVQPNVQPMNPGVPQAPVQPNVQPTSSVEPTQAQENNTENNQ